MVASIKPHRDAVGLSDGLLLIDGSWGPAAAGETWSHIHPATGEEVASFPVADAGDVGRAVDAVLARGMAKRPALSEKRGVMYSPAIPRV